jgi:hypothetical protein
MLTIMDSLFLVAAVLISFGAVIGKSSPLQLCVMMFFETIFYSINKALLLLGVVQFVDGKIRFHHIVLLVLICSLNSGRHHKHSYVRRLFRPHRLMDAGHTGQVGRS